MEDLDTYIESKGQGKRLQFKMALFTRQYIKKGAKETSKAKRSEAGQKRSKAEHKGLPLQTPAAAAAVSWVCGTQLFSSCVSMCACCCRWKWLCFLELIRPKPIRLTSLTHASKSSPNPDGRGDSGRRVVGARCAVRGSFPRVCACALAPSDSGGGGFSSLPRLKPSRRTPCWSSQKAHQKERQRTSRQSWFPVK